MPQLHPRRTAVIAALGLLAAGLVVPPGSAAPAAGDPVRVVVEFDGPTAAAVAGTAQTQRARAGRAAAVTTYDTAVASVEQQQDTVLTRASAAGVDLSDEQPLTGLLNGVVATVDEQDLAALRRVSGVARVTPDQAAYALGEANIPATGAPQVWERSDATGTALRGRGVTVAVIDTGVDYALPDLGKGLGADFRVVDGYDFVNDDADPMDDHGHGTHVAGVVAGDGTQTTTGMAPETTLTAWKVLDAQGTGTLTDILLGLEAATDPLGLSPADVVNLSLGTVGDGTDPIGRAATAATQQGVVVVAAAGNSGPGDQTISSPAAAPGVLAVGAQVTGVRLPTLRLGGDQPRELPVTRFPLSANPPVSGLSARLVDVGEGDDAGFEAAGDVSGAIVVMRSFPVGTLGEVVGEHLAQAERAEARGAAGVLLYGTSPTEPGGYGGGIGIGGGLGALAEGGWDLRRESLVMMSMEAADYRTFRDQVVAGGLTATVGSSDATDLLTDFSSRGPTDAMALKPEIVAPGFEILSSFPEAGGVEGNQYRMSGTSMAAPHVAGAAALLAQARPTATAARLRATLIGSARPLASADAGSSPSGQGAGALDVAAAVDQHVTASPDAVSLGLADMGGAGRRTATVVLRNDGRAPVTVQLALRPSNGSSGTATLSTRSLRLPAGREASVDLTTEPLLGESDSETSGQLVGTVSDGTTLRVPYAHYVRPLVVQATPDPAVGSSEVFVHSGSSLAAEGAVTLTARAPSGRSTTVALRAEPTGGAGWYRASLPLDEIGEHVLTARATVAGRTLTGTTRIRSMSPDRPGDWEQVGLLGDAARVAVSPGAPGTALALSSASPYPFVTTDRGATWRRSPSMPVAGGWGIPVADPRTPGAFYLALNGLFGRAPLDTSYRGRVLHTTDAGRTWTVLPFPDVPVEALVARGDAVAAVVPDGLVLSTDGGRSWREVRHPWSGSALTAAFAGDDLVVSDGLGLWRVADVADGGATPVGAEIRGEPEDLDHIFGVDADEDAAVAIARGGRVLRSTDGGASWTEVATDAPTSVTDISIAEGTLYLGGLSTLVTSEDYGTTLVEQEKPKSGPVVSDVDRWPGSAPGSALVTMENAGVYQTTDGASWTETGVSGTTVPAVAVGVDAAGAEVLLAVDREGLHTRRTSELDAAEPDWGATGNEGWLGRGYTAVAQSPVGDRSLWAVGASGNGQGKVLTGPAGSSVLQTVGPLRAYTATALAVSPTEADTVVVGYAALEETGLMVSRDGFETWRAHVSGRRTAQVLFDPVVADRLWLATDEGLFRSDDLGATTTRLTTAPAESVLVDPADPDRVVVGELGGISVSVDGGRTFAPAQLPTANAAVSSLVALSVPSGPAAGTRVLVAGARQWKRHGLTINGAGPFVSVDGGRTWIPADAGLSALSVRSLAVSGDGDWVYAGTDDGGVHRTPAAALVPAAEPPAVVATTTTVRAPDRARLGQRPAVQVHVRAESGARVRGTVLVAVQRAGSQVARSVETLRAGRTSYRLPKLRRTGDYRVVVTFRPPDGLAPSTGAVVIRVRR